MTAEEHQTAIQKNLSRLKSADWLLPLARSIHSAMAKRIFTDGVSGNGEKIGEYSSSPFYASAKEFANKNALQPQGKKSTAQVFRNGKLRKTMYLQQGYRQLKQVQGLASDSVNLIYTGELQQDFITGLSVEDDGITLRLSNAVNQAKLGWLEKKYGDSLFRPTQQEKEQFTFNATQAIIDCLTFSS